MPGILYVVATPIGNLSDLSPRTVETLKSCSFVAAEDTRVTLRLLNHLGIKKPLVSYRAHNERSQSEALLNRIEGGESCALCSDAGIPAVSDPGQVLVGDAHRRGIRVVPVPGPTAALTALCASGQDTTRFVFEGFLSRNKSHRAARLNALKEETRTILLYEAPHKLVHTLADLAKTFGEERSLTLCRELTKLHEEIIKTTVVEALTLYQSETPRGEFVLVLAGGAPPAAELPSLQDIARSALILAAAGLSIGEAARQAADGTGLSKNAVYKEMLRLQNV